MQKFEYPIQVQRLWLKEMEYKPPARPTINNMTNKLEQTEFDGGLIDQPAESFDQTPTDCFMWRYINDMIYNNTPRNLTDLKQSFVTAFHTINTILGKKVCESVPNRFQ